MLIFRFDKLLRLYKSDWHAKNLNSYNLSWRAGWLISFVCREILDL